MNIPNATSPANMSAEERARFIFDPVNYTQLSPQEKLIVAKQHLASGTISEADGAVLDVTGDGKFNDSDRKKIEADRNDTAFFKGFGSVAKGFLSVGAFSVISHNPALAGGIGGLFGCAALGQPDAGHQHNPSLKIGGFGIDVTKNGGFSMNFGLNNFGPKGLGGGLS